MKKLLRTDVCLLVLWIFTAGICMPLCLFMGAGTVMSSGTGVLLIGMQIVENWIEEKICGIVYLPWCGEGERLVEFYKEHFLNAQEKYIPVLPPPVPAWGDNLVFPPGSMYRWFTARGVTAYETRGVAVVIAVTPLSGTLPVVDVPQLVWFSAPLVAMSACYDRYAEVVQSEQDPLDFYAWLVVVNDAKKIGWEWDEQKRSPVPAREMEVFSQPYLCVIYRAPVEDEARWSENAEVAATLPSNPFLLGHIPASTPKASIATAINIHCKNEIGRALTQEFMEHLLHNIGSWIRHLIIPDTYRNNYGQMQAICTIAVTARYAQVLPTPTPTPTPTPVPTSTPTPTPVFRVP